MPLSNVDDVAIRVDDKYNLEHAARCSVCRGSNIVRSVFHKVASTEAVHS